MPDVIPRDRAKPRQLLATGTDTVQIGPDPSHVYPTYSGRQRLSVTSGCMTRKRIRDAVAPLSWGFPWWQVLGSNQRRLSRRFYIPEGAGRGQGAVVPVFGAVPGRVWACREEWPGSVRDARLTNDSVAGPPPGSHWIRPGNGCRGMWSARPVCSSCPGQARWAAFIQWGGLRLVAAGAWGGPRGGQRDQSEPRPGPPVVGASKTSDHALPVSGPAHAAFAS